MHFGITFGVTDYSNAGKRLSADCPWANMFPRLAVVKLHCVSITDSRQIIIIIIIIIIAAFIMRTYPSSVDV